MTEQKLDTTLDQQRLAVGREIGSELDRSDRRLRFEAAQPCGQEREGQRMRGRKAQRRFAGAGDHPRLFGQARGTRQNLGRDGVHPPPRLSQCHRMAAAVEQRHAQPMLERANPAAESRLGHVPPLRGARKVSALGQREKIFQPRQIHEHR